MLRRYLQAGTALPAIALLCLPATGLFAETAEQAPGEMTLEQYCADHPCRGPTRIFLKTDGRDFEFESPMFWPVTDGDSITILPGEELFIEAVMEDEMIVAFKQVSEIVNPERTFTLKFTQNDKDIGMLLKLTNPFDTAVKFNMLMMDFAGQFHETSSCPVAPKAALFESWPHPIVQLAIVNPRFLHDDDGYSCEY